MSKAQHFPLRKIHLYSWGLLLFLVVISRVFTTGLVSQSILIGGLVANISFWLLKKDLLGLIQGNLAVVKTKFFIKYYARLSLLAVILFVIIKYRPVNIIGLLIGLSTVMVSIVLTAVGMARKEEKEAP
ncbi:MAG: ATP synthase subunit I [Proteobacteria bacterium]|nr:ATP synthase subunit I [Pseudomonadota bacterium]MBU1687648.1 ATP synthase subunit I [Pseudomonadota bacterium]